MVNLESPLLTLGALWFVGNDERGRQFTGGATGNSLLWGGFGGASAEFLGQQLQNATGGGGALNDELAQALAGAGISRFGDVLPVVNHNAVARGIMYNVATQSAQDAGVSLDNLLGGTGLTNGGSNGGTQQAASAPAQAMTHTPAHDDDLVVV